jgi:hypothetical protein
MCNCQLCQQRRQQNTKMQIDTQHLHHWMQAIRQSPDPMRTMDAFWSGQLNSKEWLICHLADHVHTASSVEICAGWVGVLASMLFQSNIPITSITSYDIDPTCKATAEEMNKLEQIAGRFRAVVADISQPMHMSAEIIINTSCEHLTQHEYQSWLDHTPKDSLLVLQSNNYEISEHVRIAHDLEEFETQSAIDMIWSGKLQLPLYTRYMIIGRRYV